MAQVRAPRRKSNGARRRKRRTQSGWSDITSQLRRAYFAHAGELAIRYGITFDRVAQHVRHGWNHEPALSIKGVRYAEDLVHAVACVDDVGLAWSDLLDHHERMLTRACRDRLDETDAILVVRRLFVQLRRQSIGASQDRSGSLSEYLGTCSLRGWLCRCLAEAINQALAVQPDLSVRPMRFSEHRTAVQNWPNASIPTVASTSSLLPVRHRPARDIDFGSPQTLPAAGGDEIR